MIDIKTVESIHNILIDKFGGAKGIRDIGALEASLARPSATFDQIKEWLILHLSKKEA